MDRLEKFVKGLALFIVWLIPTYVAYSSVGEWDVVDVKTGKILTTYDTSLGARSWVRRYRDPNYNDLDNYVKNTCNGYYPPSWFNGWVEEDVQGRTLFIRRR